MLSKSAYNLFFFRIQLLIESAKIYANKSKKSHSIFQSILHQNKQMRKVI